MNSLLTVLWNIVVVMDVSQGFEEDVVGCFNLYTLVMS